MLGKRFKLFINPFDGRYEDLKKGNVALNVLRDFTAGLVVAAVAIPLAMGLAIASGLRPEQGIVGAGASQDRDNDPDPGCLRIFPTSGRSPLGAKILSSSPLWCGPYPGRCRRRA